MKSEYELEFTPNQILHLHQILPIYPRKVGQKSLNFETQPKPDTISVRCILYHKSLTVKETQTIRQTKKPICRLKCVKLK